MTYKKIRMAEENCTCVECANATNAYKLMAFLDEAEKVHNGKYDYSEVEYVNQTIPVKIICPEHGAFWQRPYNHTHGANCPKCVRKRIGKNRTKTTSKFIEEAKAVHGDKYDYSHAEYQGAMK